MFGCVPQSDSTAQICLHLALGLLAASCKEAVPATRGMATTRLSCYGLRSRLWTVTSGRSGELDSAGRERKTSPSAQSASPGACPTGTIPVHSHLRPLQAVPHLTRTPAKSPWLELPKRSKLSKISGVQPLAYCGEYDNPSLPELFWHNHLTCCECRERRVHSHQTPLNR